MPNEVSEVYGSCQPERVDMGGVGAAVVIVFVVRLEAEVFAARYIRSELIGRPVPALHVAAVIDLPLRIRREYEAA